MNKLSYILLACLIALLACEQEEMVRPETAGTAPASLSLSLSSFGLSVETRGLEDPSSDPSSWTAMERATDGRIIYRLTVFLVDMNNTLVAYRDIYKGSADIDASNGFWNGAAVTTEEPEGEQVKVSFDYDASKHGEIEKLAQGEYTLIAVANYSEYADGTDTYNGLASSDGNFTHIITNGTDGILDNFKKAPNTGLTDFTRANYSDFFNYRFDAGEDFVCPKRPQPLTLVKKISLLPGKNHVSGELKRLYARVRIKLANNSQEYKLQVNSFSIKDQFTQRYAYLFEDLSDPEHIYSTGVKGTPQTNSADAIVKYDHAVKEITESSETILFDAYLLESKGKAENYRYEIDVEYKGTLYSASYSSLKILPSITKINDLSKAYNNTSTTFLIQNTGNDYYLKDGGNIVGVGSDPQNNKKELHAYLWTLERGSSTNEYRIKTKEGNKYMGGPDEGLCYWKSSGWSGSYKPHANVGLSDQTSNFVQVPLAAIDKTNGIILNQSISRGWSNYEFYVSNTEGSSTVTTFGTTYHFYPVVWEPIQIQIINPETSQVAPLTNIKRNDFINIYITSNYSEKNSTLEFDVASWNERDNNIEFH